MSIGKLCDWGEQT